MQRKDKENYKEERHTYIHSDRKILGCRKTGGERNEQMKGWGIKKKKNCDKDNDIYIYTGERGRGEREGGERGRIERGRGRERGRGERRS